MSEQTSEQNKSIVQNLFALWNAKDIAGASALISEACNGGGSEGFRRELDYFLTAFPDLEISLEDILTQGDKVATRVTMRGTHQGTFMNVPATGKPVVMKANHISHSRTDKLFLVTGRWTGSS